MRVPALLSALFLVLLWLATPVDRAAAQAQQVLGSEAFDEAELKLLKRALALAKRRHWDRAAALAAQVGEPFPAKLFTWWRLARGDPKMRFADYARFIDDNPDWPQRANLLSRAEKEMDEDVADATVIAWFDRHTPISGQGRIRLADAYLAGGNTAKATEWYRYVWQHDPLAKANWRGFYNRRRSYLRQSDNVARVDRLIWNGYRTQAWALRSVLPNDQRALAEARLAMIADRHDVDARIARVPSALRDHPGLTYDRVNWRRRHGRDDGAQELLLEAPGDLGPQPEKWWVEREAQAQNLIDAGDYAKAYRIASSHGQEAGSVEYAEAEWLSGWIALRFLAKSATAAQHFQNLYNAVRYPISRARGAYWRGLTAQLMGQGNHAVRWYRLAARYSTTCYGQLAAEALQPNTMLRLQPSVTPRREHWAAFRKRDVVATAELLGTLGEWQLFRTFVLQLAEDAKRPVDHTMVGLLARHFQRYDVGVRVAKIAVRSGIQIVEHGYPLFQLPPVKAEPALVFAIMRQESEFRARATSPVGARGLMQLMPATARAVSRRLGLRYNRGRLLSDPNYNVRLGSAYIQEMIETFDGSYLLAVAAYNAGPGRVRQWIGEFGDPRKGEIDPIYWVESIPFNETRNYVQRVLEGLQVYRQRLAAGPTQSQLTMDLKRGNSTPR